VPTADDRWTLPEPGSRYPLALLGRGIEPDQASVRFFGILGLVIGVAGYSIASTSVNLFVEWLGWLLEGRPGTMADYATRSSAFETVAGLVAANLAIGSAILVAAGLLRLLHRRRATWLWSVTPGVRWRFLLACFLVGVVVLVGLQFLLSGVPALKPQPDVAAFVVAILVTSPIQAAAEEVFFRGYLMQALGLVWRREWFAAGRLGAAVRAVPRDPELRPCSSTGSCSVSSWARWCGARAAWRHRSARTSRTTSERSCGPRSRARWRRPARSRS